MTKHTELTENQFNNLTWTEVKAETELTQMVGASITDAEWMGMENGPREGLILTVTTPKSTDIYMATFNDDDPDNVFFTLKKANLKV